MHTTFRQLQLFLALAEHGSITAAARACHVTQPTVSMQLKDLTESVGLPLYEQLGKRLHLTAAGHALMKSAQNMTGEWAAFEQKIAGLKGLTQGRLAVSMVSTAKYFVPEMLGTFCARYPEIDIALQVLNRDGVVARLRENRDDLYIMSMPPDDIDLQQRMLLPNPLVVVAPPMHRLAGRRAVSLTALAGERFILREQGSGTRMACDAHFAELKFRPDVRLELGSNEAIKHAVAAGLGLAVLSRHALQPDPATDIVAVLNVRGYPVHSNWFVLYPKGKLLSPIATEFLSHLHAAASPSRRAKP
jgi:DNA-binding transcriptional LysR family regulator